MDTGESATGRESAGNQQGISFSGIYRRLWATAVAPHQNQSPLFPLLPRGSDRPSRRPLLAVCYRAALDCVKRDHCSSAKSHAMELAASTRSPTSKLEANTATNRSLNLEIRMQW